MTIDLGGLSRASVPRPWVDSGQEDAQLPQANDKAAPEAVSATWLVTRVLHCRAEVRKDA